MTRVRMQSVLVTAGRLRWWGCATTDSQTLEKSTLGRLCISDTASQVTFGHDAEDGIDGIRVAWSARFLSNAISPSILSHTLPYFSPVPTLSYFSPVFLKPSSASGDGGLMTLKQR